MSQALSAVAAGASLALAGAALLSGAVTFAVTLRPALALSVVLDLLLAAGLLRLTGEPHWRAIAASAVVVVLRHLIGYGLRLGAHSWTGPSGPVPAAVPVAELARRLLLPAWRR